MLDHRLFLAAFVVAAFASAVLLFWMLARVTSAGAARYRESFTREARASLEQMFLFIDSKQLLTVNGVAIVGFGLLAWLATGSLIAFAAGCALGFAVPRILFNLFKRRRLDAIREQLPDATMLIAGALRAGASIHVALAQVVSEMRPPISQEFDLFLREQRLGVAFDAALENMDARIQDEGMALFAAALKVSRETGGNLAETLERLAETLRTKLTIEGKIRALTAQGKLQGVIVGLLPVALAFVLFHMEPEAMSLLFNAWYGWLTIAFILVMELIGALIIKKIVTIDV